MTEESNSKEKSDDRASGLKMMELYTLVLTSLISYSGAGIGIGYLGYKFWGWPIWVMLLTGMAGLSAAFYRIYQFTQRDS